LVYNNGTDCPELTATVPITVIETLEVPNIICQNSGTDFILFGWQDQGSGNVMYEVRIDGVLVTTTSDSEYRLEGLSDNQEVEIQVIALGGDCGNAENTHMCTSQLCIPPIWGPTFQQDQCFDPANPNPVVLNINPMSFDPTSTDGELSWLELDVDANNGFIPDNGTGVYTYTAVWTEGTCVATQDIAIQVNFLPQINLTSSLDKVCAGDPITIESGYTDNPNAFFTWDVDGGNVVSGDINSAGPLSIEFTDAQAEYNITLTIDNGTGCTSTSQPLTIQVDSPNAGDFTFSPALDDLICLDGTVPSFDITVAVPDGLDGGGTATWSGEPVTDVSGTINPNNLSGGTYDLFFSYTEGTCTYNEMLEITLVDPPSVDIIDQVDPECLSNPFGEITVLGSGGLADYLYALDGQDFQSDNFYGSIPPGPHLVEIEDANGCLNELPIFINPPDDAMVNIVGPETIFSEIGGDYEFELSELNFSELVNITWYIDGVPVCTGLDCDTYNLIDPLESVLLSVELEYGDGCIIVDQKSIEVRKIQAFYVPDVINPADNDGANAEWRVYIKGDQTFPQSLLVYC